MGGSSEVADAARTDVALDLAVLAALLHADGVDANGPLVATRIGLGQSNLTYLLHDDAGSRWIARRPPRGHLLASAHDVLREHRILQALTSTDVPVPRVLGEYTDDRLAEASVVLMEYVDGLVVDRADVAAALRKDVRGAIGLSLARTLPTVHRVDVDAVGLGDLASRRPYAARQLKRWALQWEQSKTRELPALDSLTELLRRRMPVQRETSLVHGDFHMRNVILDPSGTAVRAVLDWELSTLGDPSADVGSLLAYWPEPSDGPTPDVRCVDLARLLKPRRVGRDVRGRVGPGTDRPGLLARPGIVEDRDHRGGRPAQDVGGTTQRRRGRSCHTGGYRVRRRARLGPRRGQRARPVTARRRP